VPLAVAKGLRLHGVDVLTTAEAGMLGATDEEQLAFAHEISRVIYTQDTDYLRLHRAIPEHSGIAFARQGRTVGDVVRGLLLMYDVLDAESMRCKVEFV
jgi:predicted nuclease of predicted toxin-antitoxin system